MLRIEFEFCQQQYGVSFISNLGLEQGIICFINFRKDLRCSHYNVHYSERSQFSLYC